MDTVNLTIDSIPITAPKGEKILWAALDNGIYIPHLCALRWAEEPFAGCRLCFVEVEGRPVPVTSCTEPVAEGMVVHTDTPEVKRLRRTAAELLIAAECPDCGACAKNRHCELQKIAAFVGVKLKPKRLRETPRSLPVDSSNPFFIRNPNRCVVCGRCVAVCREVVGADAINFTLRGFDIEPRIDEACESCGECVAICPVGALVPKDSRWPKQETRSVCPYCSVGCGIYLGTDGSTITSVRGDEESATNRGTLCAKGRFGIAEFVHHPDRLRSPLVRRGRGFVEVSWEEAIELIATSFARYKGEEFALIASARGTNEDSYVLQKFARAVMGSNNIDNSSRLCDAPSALALRQSFGSAAMTNPMDDIEGAACILVIGTNPTSSHPILGQRIRRAARNGASLIVANPREIELCRHATLWLRDRPGSDLALLMGMMRVILDEGLADLSFIEERCQDFEGFRQSTMGFDLDLVERLTGVAEEQVREAARIFATHRPALIVYASGLTQQVHGSENVFALTNLAMLTGNIGKISAGLAPLKGQNNAQGASDMGLVPDLLPGHQSLAEPDVRRTFETAWGCHLNPTTGLSLGDILEAAYQRRIRALYIAGANPALNMANIRYVRRALRRVEFLVAQDIFLSETARIAHVVLPAASFAEKDGTFTNTERRVQLVRRAIDTIGDSRPDWQIACHIARKMGVTGFDFENSAQIMDEISSLVPDYAGISHHRLEKVGIQWPCPTKEHPGTPLLHAETFARGKGMFTPPSFKPEPSDQDYPLILTTERSLYHMGSMSRKVRGLDMLRAEELVEINPHDAASAEVADGEMVLVTSRSGGVKARARVTEASPPGVVSMSGHFAKSAANLVTSSALDEASRVPPFKRTAVRIERAL